MKFKTLLSAALLAWPIAIAAPASLAQAGESTALAAALAAVREDHFTADIYFLAGDELRGRDTPSPELRIAALYIKARVERLGFTPGAEGGGWMHEYSLRRWRMAPEHCLLQASKGDESLDFRIGSDYYLQLASHATNLDIRGETICVGSASKRSLEGLDLNGKWAVLLDTGKVVNRSVDRCFLAGAVGVLVTPGPKYSKKPYAERYQRRADRMLDYSRFALDRGKEAAEPFPVVMLDREAAGRLFTFCATPLQDGYPAIGASLGIELHEQRAIELDQPQVSNVCAFWPGSDPELASETMIVSAHYDHVGVKDGEIYNGADDNASGTCGLLALADALVAYGPMQRSVLLLWVSGEEKNLWGSEMWARSGWLPGGARAVLDLNIDMIGRTEDDELYITPSDGHESYNSVARAAYALAAQEGFPELESQDEYWTRSDHVNFERFLDIPVAFLSSGEHPDYHKPSDTPDKIKGAKSVRIVRLVFRMLDELQGAELGD